MGSGACFDFYLFVIFRSSLFGRRSNPCRQEPYATSFFGSNILAIALVPLSRQMRRMMVIVILFVFLFQ
jgi:hypothetical protein